MRCACLPPFTMVALSVVVGCGARTSPGDWTGWTGGGASHGTPPADAGRDGGSDAVTACSPPASSPAPRLVAPLSTSRVTARRPTLRWALPSCVAATVDICLDRACTRPVGTPAQVTGTRYVPANDLPSGVVYWRVHLATDTTSTSATWELTVGARSASVDSSWGTTLDVNGDGYADLAVGSPELTGSFGGSAYVYLGGAHGLAGTPAATLTAPDAGSSWTVFGYSVASAGDVNGDGYSDLVVGATDASGVRGAAYLYLGGPQGLATTPAVTLADPGGATGDYFGASVASAGDLNGDGYADVVVATGAGHEVYVYLGGASGLGATPSTTLTRPGAAPGDGGSASGFGFVLASAGDVNGDGYSDLVVGNRDPGGSTGAYVYLGGANGLATTPSSTPALPGFLGFAYAGDVNGDGYDDVVVQATGTPTDGGFENSDVYLYLGGPQGLVDTPKAVLSSPGNTEYFGQTVTSAGDVDGDGYADLLVGGYGSGSGNPEAYVYLGGPDGFAATPSSVAANLGGTYGFGGGVSAGDVNGDGYVDLAVFSSSTEPPGAPYIISAYLGSAAGVATSPEVTLIDPGGTSDDSFGYSVFGAAN